jgi:crotonobetainyl-CoA:carnitine CoA-transferase CaiB-like acyl-CoA transferase
VQTLAEFMKDPGVRHQGMVRDYDHPEAGRLSLIGQAVTLAPDAPRDAGPPPTLGQHTDEVLRDLGYDAGTIADLKKRRVVDSRLSGIPRKPGAAPPTTPPMDGRP